MLVLMRYWARLMASGVPEIVTVLSLDPSSELDILIVAPDSCLISLILAPPFPITQPIRSLGIVISVVVVVALAKAAAAAVPGRRLLVAANVAKAGLDVE